MSATATWEQDVFEEGPEEIEIRRGLMVTRVAAGALMLTGLMHAASMLQMLLFGNLSFPVVAAEVTFVALAIVHVAAGSRVYDGSPVASGLGAASAFGGAGFAALWFLWLLASGVLGLLPMLLVGAGGLCGVLTLASLPFALRVAAARRKLVDG
jgi:hypothetical protein